MRIQSDCEWISHVDYEIWQQPMYYYLSPYIQFISSSYHNLAKVRFPLTVKSLHIQLPWKIKTAHRLLSFLTLDRSCKGTVPLPPHELHCRGVTSLGFISCILYLISLKVKHEFISVSHMFLESLLYTRHVCGVWVRGKIINTERWFLTVCEPHSTQDAKNGH